MSTPYHAGYQPPFPQLTVVLHAGDDHLGPYTALLDSGADTTLIPSSWLEEIGAMEGERARIRSHFGEYQPVRLYVVDIQVQDFLLPGTYVAGNDVSDEIILGRDVLNRLSLFLDGPQQRGEVLDDAIVKRLRARRE